MNEFGRSVEGLIELAELTSCVKRTMAHVLIIIVAIGFGVTKPRLGSVRARNYSLYSYSHLHTGKEPAAMCRRSLLYLLSP